MLFTNGDVFTFRMFVRAFDQNFISVHDVQYSHVGPSISVPASDFFNPYMDEYAALLRVILPAAAEIMGYGVRQKAPNETQEVLSAHGSAPGQVVSDPLPAQVTYLLSLRADTAPPGMRGRKYFGPVPDTAIMHASGELMIPVQNNLESLGTFFIEDQAFTVGASEITFHAGLYNKEFGIFYPYTSALARAYPATQRRRALNSGGDDLVFG